jgi:protoporphyrinogen oxidase
MKMHITVLGGGPGGCAVGYFAKKKGIKFAIYEADDEAGGFCRTMHHGPFSYDTGAHRFHDKNPDVTRDIRELMGDELRQIYVPSQIWISKGFVDFPLSPLNLAGTLGIPGFLRAAVQVFRERVSGTKQPPVHFEDFARSTYGDIIAEKFLLNYSEKLWGQDCRLLSPEIAGKRMEGLDLKTFVKEALFGKKAKTEHLDGVFYYPAHGYGSITKKLISFFGTRNIHNNSTVTKILSNGKQKITAIEINGQKIRDVDQAVSTLPLNVFFRLLHPVPPDEIRGLADNVHYRDLILIVLFLDTPSITENATVYFPGPEFPFTRVYEPKNRSPEMSPPGKTSLVIEIPSQRGDAHWRMSDEELTELASSKLSGIGWICEDQLIDAVVLRKSFAYPILEKTYAAKVERMTEYLARFNNLRLSGRNGTFMYTHFHDMMALGKRITDELAALDKKRQDSG